MIPWLAFAVSLLGFAWIALAMRVHWIRVHGGAGPTRKTQALLRAAGSIALAAALGLCAIADPASMAVLVWMLLLAAAVVVVALMLRWRPAVLRWSWPRGPAQPPDPADTEST